MSQPCTSYPSFFQWMLLASPHTGLLVLLRLVIWLHLPISPAQISGGALKELRITAEVLPSRATDKLAPQKPIVICSAPRNISWICPFPGSTVAIPASPCTYSPNRIFWSGVHVGQLAEAFISCVAFFASPPLAAMVYTSPPTLGSSLINPAMNAMVFPSGDHAGLAICSGGLWIDSIKPVAASSVYSSAIYQLL